MKLTLKIKLLPNSKQAKSLLDTIKEANFACNKISKIAWNEKIFNQFKIHHKSYYSIREKFNLSAQMVIHCISKVCNSYKLNRKKLRIFNPFGAIAYDERILSYKSEIVSIWSINGRLKIPFICHRHDWLPYIKGEADLITKKGKYFLLQTVEFPEEKIKDVEEFLGVDFGVVDIVSISNGKSVSSKWINDYRLKREKIRSSIQRKGTKGAKKLLKRLSGRERITATLINHTLSKRIVSEAKKFKIGIAIENLKGIRKAIKLRKKQRGLRHKWSFSQLRFFLEYKALMNGIPLIAVDPAYTSQICSSCQSMGVRKGKLFACKTCNNIIDADYNASKNIAARAVAINQPGKLSYVNHLHTSGLKPQLLAVR